MGTLSDIGQFERVNLGYMWDKLRDDPERAFIGAIDPFSSWMWGGILGKEYDPVINQLGGPAGGGPLATGNTGGVYQRAQDKGIDTTYSAGSHDIAELIASFYGGAGASSGLGNAFGSGASSASSGASSGLLNASDAAALEAASASASSAGAGGSGILGSSTPGAAGVGGDITAGWQAQNAANLQGTLSTPAFQAPTANVATDWGGLLNQSMDMLGNARRVGGQPQQPSLVTSPAQERRPLQSNQERTSELQRIQQLQLKQRRSPDEQRELQTLQTRNRQTVIR